MKDDTPKPGDAASPEAEPFLARWSRRKGQARQQAEVPPVPPEEHDEAAGSDAGAGAGTAAGATGGATSLDAELPDLGSLDGDSDYSAFMAQGVDESLRREALRRLFRSPKFNVLDGLDDYCGDFTRWEGLGDIVTADMRHQMERAARLAEKALAEAEDREQVPGKVASRPVVQPATEEAPGDGTEEHERKEDPA